MSSIIYVFAVVLGRRAPRKHPYVTNVTLHFSSDCPAWLSVLQQGKLSAAEAPCPTSDTIHSIIYCVVDFMRQKALAHL